MTATNKCYNFVGFRCRLPLKRKLLGISKVFRVDTGGNVLENM